MRGFAACKYAALHLDVPAILHRPAMAVPDFFVQESTPRIPTSSRFAGPWLCQCTWR